MQLTTRARLPWLLAVALASGVAVIIPGGGPPAAAGPARSATASFAVLRRAHAASANASLGEPLDGAASTEFATSVGADEEVFVAAMTDGDVCLIDQTAAASPSGGLMTVGCAHPASAAQAGIALITPPSVPGGDAAVTLLVPDGVNAVTLTQTDGGERTIAVTNNVAHAEGPLTSAAFTTTGGVTVTTQIALASAASAQR